ncbi:MAG TPA: DUF4231 domain-containing protein [Actinobacteria bacterium]|nr:hypothetical protein BMS3Bbin01_02448 [bacterium BMS3Bbin01]HDH25735.1 DUF4231 domain-containing protein [Actinomycetota bacterium]
MTEMTLPGLFVAADRISAREQKTTLRFRKFELTFLVTAVAFTQFTWISNGLNLPGLASFLLLLSAAAAKFLSLRATPEHDWYIARTVAESAKSHAWQYAVGGADYPMDDTDARTRYRSALADLQSSFHGLDVPTGTASSLVVTPWMDETRKLTMADRRGIYRLGRVADQQCWYSRKSHWNRKRAKQWSNTLIVAELLAALLSLMRALGWLAINWASLLSAGAAAVIAWQQTKRYSELSESYALASHDLAIADDNLNQASNEPEWAAAVLDSENALSRENKMWVERRPRP